MQIDWWTLALQGINFLVLVWLLKRFLYRPVREIIDQRKALASEALEQAKERETQAEEALRRFEDDRVALEKEREQMRVDMHHTLEAERAKIRAEAEDISAKTLAKARQSIDEERADAADQMREAALGLAADMAGKILASSDPATLTTLALTQIEKKLTSLNADTKNRLETHLKEGGTLAIVTAQALKAPEKKRWEKMVSSRLPLEGPADFSVDESLIGGAELRLAHITLGFTVADQLAEMKKELLSDDRAQDRS